jgi:hypothetical protein
MKNAPATINAGASALAKPAGELVSLNPELLIAKAIEANVPVESLERLLAMRSELKREQAAVAFNHALANFQAEIPPIVKSKTARVQGRNGSFSYNYADIAAIQRAIAPRLKECGLSVTFDTQQEGETLHVFCIVHHIDGHAEKTGFPVPIDRAARMNDSQKIGSALTYGRRYALCAALGIVTAEDDDDGQAATNTRQAAAPTPAPPAPTPATSAPQAPEPAPVISAAQHRRIEARINELGLDRERVKSWIKRAWGVEHLNKIPADRHNAINNRLTGWKNEIYAEKVQAEQAIRLEQSAIKEAGRLGWSGVIEELPELIDKLSEKAKRLAEMAQYAERGYSDEMAKAKGVKRTAELLEHYYKQQSAQAEREAIQSESN